MYMNETVGVAERRQNLSVYLRRVSRGERLVVTDRNRPVAELGPAPTTGPALDRLIAVTDADGRSVRYRYDALGRLTTVADAGSCRCPSVRVPLDQAQL